MCAGITEESRRRTSRSRIRARRTGSGSPISIEATPEHLRASSLNRSLSSASRSAGEFQIGVAVRKSASLPAILRASLFQPFVLGFLKRCASSTTTSPAAVAGGLRRTVSCVSTAAYARPNAATTSLQVGRREAGTMISTSPPDAIRLLATVAATQLFPSPGSSARMAPPKRRSRSSIHATACS